MTLTNKVWTILENDGKLRRQVAYALRVGDVAVFQAVKRRSDTLTKIAAIRAIEAYTGLNENEILETETATA